MKRLPALILILAFGLAACSPAPSSLATSTVAPTATPPPVETSEAVATVGGESTPVPDNWVPPTPIPPLTSGKSPTELKYQILALYPDLFYCDPDYYPVARADEAELAEQRFPKLQANEEEFNIILKQLSLSATTQFAQEQKLAIYREHKRLAAVLFTLDGDGYQYQLQTQDSSGNGFLITGRINGNGEISGEQKQPSFTTCPICLSGSTLIDTPNGPTPVKALSVGDLVWTLDAAGRRVAAPLALVGHVPAPVGHHMVHLVLSDGRQVRASAGHPTADGRPLGTLSAGDALDGAWVVSAERVLYGEAATYDVLPAGATGVYWADGVQLGSTLR